MSTRYEAAMVDILNLTVSPTLTLISVAKPWIVELPAPAMAQILLEVPGLEFSQAIGFTTGAQGSAAAARSAIGTVSATRRAMTDAARSLAAINLRMAPALLGRPEIASCLPPN